MRTLFQFDLTRPQVSKFSITIGLSIETFCYFIVIWLFGTKYYETASDIECLLLKSSIILNKSKKRRLKYGTGIMLALLLLFFIPYDILLLSHTDKNQIKITLAAILASLSTTFVLTLLLVMAIAFSKLFKLIRSTDQKLSRNNTFICAQMFGLLAQALSCLAMALIFITNMDEVYSFESLSALLVIDVIALSA
mgnify:CR=1 FL=1